MSGKNATTNKFDEDHISDLKASLGHLPALQQAETLKRQVELHKVLFDKHYIEKPRIKIITRQVHGKPAK